MSFKTRMTYTYVYVWKRESKQMETQDVLNVLAVCVQWKSRGFNVAQTLIIFKISEEKQKSCS